MVDAFAHALLHVLTWEGGLVHHPKDPGGLTKFGISSKAYPKLDIAALTAEQARNLYFRDYWLPAGCVFLRPSLALLVFDAAVLSGPKRAKLWLAEIGTGAGDLNRYTARRLQYYRALKTWADFGRGWQNRTEAALATACKLELFSSPFGELPNANPWNFCAPFHAPHRFIDGLGI